VLTLIGSLAGDMREQILTCKPKIQLPGGVALEMG
jgi:hypothetical protein